MRPAPLILLCLPLLAQNLPPVLLTNLTDQKLVQTVLVQGTQTCAAASNVPQSCTETGTVITRSSTFFDNGIPPTFFNNGVAVDNSGTTYFTSSPSLNASPRSAVAVVYSMSANGRVSKFADGPVLGQCTQVGNQLTWENTRVSNPWYNPRTNALLFFTNRYETTWTLNDSCTSACSTTAVAWPSYAYGGDCWLTLVTLKSTNAVLQIK
jgi:hypothetical protein